MDFRKQGCLWGAVSSEVPNEAAVGAFLGAGLAEVLAGRFGVLPSAGTEPARVVKMSRTLDIQLDGTPAGHKKPV